MADWSFGVLPWLNANGVAVTAVVTAVYALFTWGLWRETRAAARTAAEQIRLMRVDQGLRLRPYVSIAAEVNEGGANPFECRFVLANKGPVPAHIRLLTGSLWVNDQQQPATDDERHGVIFPEPGHLVTEWLRIADGARIASGEVTVRARLRLEYTGAADPSTPDDALRIHISEANFLYSPADKNFRMVEPTIAT